MGRYEEVAKTAINGKITHEEQINNLKKEHDERISRMIKSLQNISDSYESERKLNKELEKENLNLKHQLNKIKEAISILKEQ